MSWCAGFLSLPSHLISLFGLLLHPSTTNAMRVTEVLNQLKSISMSLWSTKPLEAAFAKERILRHYKLKGLESRGVEHAEVR